MKKTKSKIHLPGQKQVKLTHTHTHSHKPNIKAEDDVLNQNDTKIKLYGKNLAEDVVVSTIL